MPIFTEVVDANVYLIFPEDLLEVAICLRSLSSQNVFSVFRFFEASNLGLFGVPLKRVRSLKRTRSEARKQ